MTVRQYNLEIEELQEAITDLNTQINDAQKQADTYNNLAYSYIAQRDRCKKNDKSCRNHSQSMADARFDTRNQYLNKKKQLEKTKAQKQTALNAAEKGKDKLIASEQYIKEIQAEQVKETSIKLADMGTSQAALLVAAQTKGEAQIIEATNVSEAQAESLLKQAETENEVKLRSGKEDVANKKRLYLILAGFGILALIVTGFFLFKKLKQNKTKK